MRRCQKYTFTVTHSLKHTYVCIHAGATVWMRVVWLCLPDRVVARWEVLVLRRWRWVHQLLGVEKPSRPQAHEGSREGTPFPGHFPICFIPSLYPISLGLKTIFSDTLLVGSRTTSVTPNPDFTRYFGFGPWHLVNHTRCLSHRAAPESPRPYGWWGGG